MVLPPQTGSPPFRTYVARALPKISPHCGLTAPDQSWFAVTVRPNHERTAERALVSQGMESFLPEYPAGSHGPTVKKKNRGSPLFPGYLFCRFSDQDWVQVLRSPGVRGIVGTRHRPVAVDESEISNVRALVSSGRPILPWPYLRAGERVTIREGPLASLSGVVVRAKNHWRVVVSVEALSCSVSVELDADTLGPARGSYGTSQI
jgi:transcriptional antiterminator NusG